MTQQDQLILVCEKLLGYHIYVPFDGDSPMPVCRCGKIPQGHDPLPPLTLDLMWGCEEKLSQNQIDGYTIKLGIVIGDERLNKYNASWDRIHATAKQRLAALVETIKDL